jgi:rod shape-determining protein MreB
VFLVDEPTAAGIGAGLPVTEPRGSMIVDIGGGTTEVAVLSLAGVVHAECLRVAGDDFDDAIIRHMRTKYNLLIGELTAEKIKLAIGSCMPLEQEYSLEVRGRDYLTGLPRKAIIGSDEVREAMREPLRLILEAIKTTLEKTPPELAADILNEGITLCGGGALLRQIAELIMEETELPVRVAEDPLTCVARGTGMFLENLDLYSRYLDGNEDVN